MSHIKSIQFGLLNPTDIIRLSVVHVIHPETTEHGIPKENGLSDLRMGTTEKNFLCATCGKGSFDCQGHPGHIELVKPMFHVGFMNRIKKVLESVCFYCSRVKLIIPENESLKKESLSKTWSLTKSKSVCPHCSNKQPIIKREGLLLFAFMKGDDSSEGKIALTGEKVHTVFKRIPDSDLLILGFDSELSRPEWMLITTLIVAPPSARPSVMSETALRSEDDLTFKYADIIKSNTNLKRYEEEGAPAHVIRDYEQLVQFHVATLIDNDIAGQPQALQKNGRPLKALSARLKGKEGRLRGNLMGKRVDFSARSVITPDPHISLDELGIPKKIAMIHTFPEKVTEWNKEILTMAVKNGPHKHPGANYVVRTDGTRVDLRFNRGEILLEQGCIVERHLKNGDYVIFNRQPSLHKMSIMSHRAKILEGSTFRLNLSATSPYNADFDGDEMNLHSVQSYLAKAELVELMAVPKNILSAQSCKPVMGIVQDSLLGSAKITQNGVFLTEGEFFHLCYTTVNFNILSMNTWNRRPAILRPSRLYTGKQAFSVAIPNFNFKNKGVLIRNGHLLVGIADKKLLGTGQGSLIHLIAHELGPNAIRDFIDNVQGIITAYLSKISSFSIGIGDCIAKTTKKFAENAISEVDELIKLATKKGGLTRIPGMDLKATFETRATLALNKARDLAGKKANESLSVLNALKQMVSAGSKGSLVNVSQVTACVGQQNVEGQRIGFSFRERTLPHFSKHDHSALARGFVVNSYISGLNPFEFFFHAMGGREGLIDTACKTAETGYLQRRIVKALEDAKIEFDGSVRGSGQIYQFLYGDDGFDSSRLIKTEDGMIPFVLTNKVKIEEKIRNDQNLLEINKNLNIADSSNIGVEKEGFLMSNQTNSNFEVFGDPWKELVDQANLLCYSPNKNVENAIRRIPPSQIPIVGPKILKFIRLGQVPLGEMVGTLAAQSIGEPATQMTLNTFHLAGVASTVTQGVPRLKEIINVAKKIRTPSHRIKLVDSSLQGARNAALELEFVTISMVLKSATIIYDPDVFTTCVESDKDFVEAWAAFPDEEDATLNYSPWLLRLVIDRDSLIGRVISFESVGESIKSAFGKDVHVLCSDENADELVVRLRVVNDESDCSFYRKLLSSIESTVLRGVKGINRVFLVKENEDWEIQTDGVAFQEILRFDFIKTALCNDLNSVFEILGIEATREAIFRELKAVIEAAGAGVNQRHLSLLCDVMTLKGLKGITRHGVNRAALGALKRSSFEETVEILLEAACTAEKNLLIGVTENIMVGQIAPMGTGLVSCTLDIQKLKMAKPLAKKVEYEFMAGTPRISSPSIRSPISNVSFSPRFSPKSPMLGRERSPSYSPTSPVYSPTSSIYVGGSTAYSPTSPAYTSSTQLYSPTSTIYSSTSPKYTPTSPLYNATSPTYKPDDDRNKRTKRS